MALLGNPTVLIVEDDDWLRRALAVRLERAGCIALKAADADRAIRALELREDVDIVCTDVDMPGAMDGVDLAALVRLRWPMIQVVVTSGKRRPRRLPACAEFVSKANGIEGILPAIDRLMSLSGRMLTVQKTLA